MYLYQIDNKLVVSETKRPCKEDFPSGLMQLIKLDKALSEWQNNLIPVKEENRKEFLDFAITLGHWDMKDFHDALNNN